MLNRINAKRRTVMKSLFAATAFAQVKCLFKINSENFLKIPIRHKRSIYLFFFIYVMSLERATTPRTPEPHQVDTVDISNPNRRECNQNQSSSVLLTMINQLALKGCCISYFLSLQVVSLIKIVLMGIIAKKQGSHLENAWKVTN